MDTINRAWFGGQRGVGQVGGQPLSGVGSPARSIPGLIERHFVAVPTAARMRTVITRAPAAAPASGRSLAIGNSRSKAEQLLLTVVPIFGPNGSRIRERLLDLAPTLDAATAHACAVVTLGSPRWSSDEGRALLERHRVTWASLIAEWETLIARHGEERAVVAWEAAQLAQDFGLGDTRPPCLCFFLPGQRKPGEVLPITPKLNGWETGLQIFGNVLVEQLEQSKVRVALASSSGSAAIDQASRLRSMVQALRTSLNGRLASAEPERLPHKLGKCDRAVLKVLAANPDKLMSAAEIIEQLKPPRPAQIWNQTAKLGGFGLIEAHGKRGFSITEKGLGAERDLP